MFPNKPTITPRGESIKDTATIAAMKLGSRREALRRREVRRV